MRGWLARRPAVPARFYPRAGAYRFDTDDKDDWIAQHFFTGGIMPSHGLIRQFPDFFTVERDWRWNGPHYQRTAEALAGQLRRPRRGNRGIAARVYGDEATLWRRRWRLFFLAVAGLFGHDEGVLGREPLSARPHIVT